MDHNWATPDHVPRAEAPAPALLEACWRATSPTGRVLTCAIYRGPVDSLVELRATYVGLDLERRQVARDLATARTVADTWLTTAIDRGFTPMRTEGSSAAAESSA
jgi:hypothetical protein